MKNVRLLKRLPLLVLVLSGCSVIPLGGSGGFDQRETWALQPFYGELRFLILQEGAGTPLPGATLQVSHLRIDELETGEAVHSDQQGLIVVHQRERGILYYGNGPPPPSFSFAAAGFETQSYSVDDLVSGTEYHPYRSADLPTTRYAVSGQETELPVYEFTITLAPATPMDP